MDHHAHSLCRRNGASQTPTQAISAAAEWDMLSRIQGRSVYDAESMEADRVGRGAGGR
jgi:hypothetical protein